MGEDSPETNAAAQVSLHTEENEDLIGPPRASSLYKACMRMHVLGTKFKRKRKEVLTLRERIIFGLGKSAHHWIQNTPDIFGDKRRGWWKCQFCKAILYFGAPPAGDYHCPNCNAPVYCMIYEEHAVSMDFPLRVTGHPDMYLDMGDSELYTTELKTMNGEDFTGLVAPLIEHNWQLQTYMWATGEQPIEGVNISKDKGYIVYVTKRIRPGEFPVKSFTVRRDAELLKRMHAKLKLYSMGLKKFPSQIPPRQPVCERSPNCYQAKSCAVYSDCFSIKSKG